MIYNVRQHTSTASCIDILATSPLCCTGKSSSTAEMSGPLPPCMVERSRSSWIKHPKGSVGIAPDGPPAQQQYPPKSLRLWGLGGPKLPSSPSELSRLKETRFQGQILFQPSRAESRQWPCKYSGCRGLGSISPKILLIGRPKVALVFFRIKIRGNMTWYLVKNIQFTSYLSVWQHV
jgi:hypothetical protein